MDNFMFNYIFYTEKDQPLLSAKQFKAKIYKKYRLEINNELFVAINNYQIKKYGSPLENPKRFGVNYQDLLHGILLLRVNRRNRLRRK